MTTENQLVPADLPADIAIRQFTWESQLQSEGPRAGRYITNIDAVGADGFALASAAKGAPTFRAEDKFVETFPAVWYYLHEIDAVTKSGEVITTPRTVFIAKDLTTISFVSQSIIDGLADLVKYFGAGPWNPPLPLRIVQSQTRNGFRIFSIRVEHAKKTK